MSCASRADRGPAAESRLIREEVDAKTNADITAGAFLIASSGSYKNSVGVGAGAATSNVVSKKTLRSVTRKECHVNPVRLEARSIPDELSPEST